MAIRNTLDGPRFAQSSALMSGEQTVFGFGSRISLDRTVVSTVSSGGRGKTAHLVEIRRRRTELPPLVPEQNIVDHFVQKPVLLLGLEI